MDTNNFTSVFNKSTTDSFNVSNASTSQYDPCIEQPLQAGCSAVWKGSYPIFYGMHIGGIIQIALSILGSLVVILAIGKRLKDGSGNGGFSDRFPLYVAVTDFLWGVSHMADHIVILSTHYYPPRWVVLLLSNTNYFFMGYQQLMYAGVALYTYLKIVRRVSLSLGAWDWKLHALCILTVASITVMYDVLGLLGVSRYWLVQAEGDPWWAYPNYFTCTLVLTQAICTIITYSLIKRSVTQHRDALTSITKDPRNTTSNSYHGTAEQCLTTFVMVGILIYLPFALVAWLIVILDLAKYDVFALTWLPVTLWFLILFLCNAGGFANAVAYFRNEGIKSRAAKLHKSSTKKLGSVKISSHSHVKTLTRQEAFRKQSSVLSNGTTTTEIDDLIDEVTEVGNAVKQLSRQMQQVEEAVRKSSAEIKGMLEGMDASIKGMNSEYDQRFDGMRLGIQNQDARLERMSNIMFFTTSFPAPDA